MSPRWRLGCIISLFIVLLFFIVGGLFVYGYAGLEITLETEAYSIEIDDSYGAIGMAIVDVFLGNALSAAEEMIEGVNAEVNLVFENPSIVPIYVPDMEHRVYINDRECESMVETDSMWLGPRESKTIPRTLLITTDELPQIALEALAYGGGIDIDLKSELTMGAFTISKKCSDQPEIIDPLSSRAESYSTTKQTTTQTFSPRINRAQWRDLSGTRQINSTTEGTRVTLYVSATGYDGTVEVDIYEVDPISPDDYVTTVQFTISDGIGKGSWTTQWKSDWGGLGGNPEYKFSVQGRESGELTVTKKPTPTPIVVKSINRVQWRDSSATWQIGQTTEDSMVTLYVEATGYDGSQLKADIYEVDPVSPDDYEGSVNISINNGKGIGYWTAKWQSDWGGLGGDPEYKFIMAGRNSGELSVVKAASPIPTYTPIPTPTPTPVSQDSDGDGIPDSTDLFDQYDARVRVSITYFASIGSHGDGLEGGNQEAYFSITVNGIKKTNESKGLQNWSLNNPFSATFNIPDNNWYVSVSIEAWEHDYLSGNDHFDINPAAGLLDYETTYDTLSGPFSTTTTGMLDGDMRGELMFDISVVSQP